MKKPTDAASEPRIAPMPITRLLQDTAFGPDEIAVLVAAYEDALRALSLVNRTDPATEMVAKKIIELAKQGERDPVRLRERVIEAVSSRPPSVAPASTVMT
jgi:hypothetical protein